MNKPHDLQCYLVGGTCDERLQIAIKLRRRGVVTDFDYGDQSSGKRKRKAWKRAIVASPWGETVVYDLGKPDDREYILGNERCFGE